jgi:hypothetical protein
MAHSGEIRLRRERDQTLTACEFNLPQSQVFIERQIAHRRAVATSVFTNAVDRVVIVDGEDARGVRRKRITLSDQFDRCGRIRGEDHIVRAFIDIEKTQQCFARRVNDLSAGARWPMLRMRIAEHPFAQQLVMRADLRLRVQRAAGVIEIHVILAIEPRKLARAQFRE